MKKALLTLLAALVVAAPVRAAKLNIVATTPDLADMTKEIGGKHVSVVSLARGTEDIHQVVMRPSFVPKLNRADGVVYIGLTVEHAFLPGLLDAAVNPKMRTDPMRECVGSGCIRVSKGVPILDKPASLARSEGELHPYGNPHINVGPQNGPIMAKNIAEGLERLDPADKADYEKNLKDYEAKLDAKLAEWKKLVAPLQGLKAISYHEDVSYLAAFTGLKFVDTVELKPGVAPTPTHVAKLVDEMKAQGVKLIAREHHFDPKIPEWLAARTGAKIAVIAIMGNAMPHTGTWIDMQDANLHNLVDAVAGAKGGS